MRSKTVAERITKAQFEFIPVGRIVRRRTLRCPRVFARKKPYRRRALPGVPVSPHDSLPGGEAIFPADPSSIDPMSADQKSDGNPKPISGNREDRGQEPALYRPRNCRTYQT